MKTKVTILKIAIVVVLLLQSMFLFAQTGFNKDEELFVSAWVDPTFDDKGFQFGADITKEMEWFFLSASMSTYPELEDGYVDLVFTPGLAFNFFENQNFTLYGGGRVGAILRGGDPYGILGMSFRLQVKIWKELYAGIMLWVEHRSDQEDNAYGDSDGYQPGIIFKGPLTQENGAGFITFKIN